MGKGNDPNCATTMAFVTASDGMSAADIAHLPAAERAKAAAELLRSEENRQLLKTLDVSLIVDMDDTLISNQSLFDDAQVALVAIFSDLDAAGRDSQTLNALHQQMDNDNIATMGYSPRRWYFSAFQAAQQFAGRRLTAQEREAVKQAAGIAMGTGEILPGAEKTLATLQECGVSMLLKTKGAAAKQNEKLAVHRFDRFFGDRIEIVDRKDETTFRDLTNRHDLGRVVSIGDSAKSDIVPAIAAGHEAILIDKTAHGVSDWSFEAVDGLDVPRTSSFAEAVLLLAERMRDRQPAPA
jgi:FMN phosphatase YigB (HAD superfamily)